MSLRAPNFHYTTRQQKSQLVKLHKNFPFKSQIFDLQIIKIFDIIYLQGKGTEPKVKAVKKSLKKISKKS